MKVDCPWEPGFAPSQTRCRSFSFEDGIFILLPSAAFLIVAPFRLHVLVRRKSQAGFVWLAALKVVLTFSIFALSLILVGLAARSGDFHETLAISSLSIVVIASAVLCLLSHLEHARSERPSILVQTYLLVVVLVNAYHLRAVWFRSQSHAVFGVSVVQETAYCLLLCAESLRKQPAVRNANKKHAPEDFNGIFNQRLFWWLVPLFKQGYSNPLQPNDLFQMDQRLLSPKAQHTFDASFHRLKVNYPRTAIFRAMWAGLWAEILSPVIPNLLFIGCGFAQPFIIQALINYVEHRSGQDEQQGKYLVVGVTLVYLGLAIFGSWYWQSVTRYETKLRACLTTSIYRKALRAKADPNSSAVMLMNVDVEKILQGMRTVHEFWGALLTIVICLYLLQRQIGISFLSLVGVAVVGIIISYFVGKIIRPRQVKWLESTQERVKFISSIPGVMKTIKMLGISEKVFRIGSDLREREVNAQRHTRKPVIVSIVFSTSLMQLASLVTYLTYGLLVTLRGGTLTTQQVFTSLAILNLFAQPLLNSMQSVPILIQSVSGLQRIQSFLLAEERPGISNGACAKAGTQQKALRSMHFSEPSKIMVELEDVSYSYDGSQAVVSGISCNVRQGTFTLILGSVASGKSTLLKMLVGDILPNAGSIQIAQCPIALCEQTVWIMPETFKDNIIGQHAFKADWFARVVWACCLEQDVQELPNGVDTKLGEGGSSLSEGQKKRIALARALYSCCGIFVLDDILAGLDNKVSAAVFARVFSQQGLLRAMDVTTIMATSSNRWTTQADNTVILSSGRMIYCGPPSIIPKDQHLFYAGPEPPPPDTDIQSAPGTLGVVKQAAPSTVLATPGNDTDFTKVADMTVYKQYLASFGPTGAVIYFVLLSFLIAASTLQSFWLKLWAGADVSRHEKSELAKYVSGFAVISMLYLGINIVHFSYMLWYMMPKSSKALHALQLGAVLRTSFTNFIKWDPGNLTNRFSQDIALVDGLLHMGFINATHYLFQAVASSVLLILAVKYIAAVIPVVVAIFYIIQKVYLRTSKQLRVMELDAKAPLVTHFTSSLAGSLTIESFGWTKQYLDKNEQLLDQSQVSFYLLKAIQNWLSLVLDLTVAGLAVLLSSLAVGLRHTTDSGYLGLALIAVMDLGFTFRVLITSWTQLETSLGAVARTNKLINAMPPEDDGGTAIPPGWPAGGDINIEGLVAGYNGFDEPILKGVHLSVKAGTKFAVCGRTGSGKSSLLAALLGMLHTKMGSIQIDGIPTSSINQELLRSKIIALPQDPWFIPGSVRANLLLRPATNVDTSDERLLRILDEANLRTTLENFSRAGDQEGHMLDMQLLPEKMLTTGEMQMFAVARAILTEGEIVVVDEATSRLDAHSELIVMDLVRNHFAGKTVLAVAHRLNTLMDFDLVGVMEGGNFVEIGNPRKQADTKGSRFRDLLGKRDDDVFEDAESEAPEIVG